MSIIWREPPQSAKESQVVCLGGAAGKNDLGCPAPQGVGNLHSSLVDEPFRIAPCPVQTRGIAEIEVQSAQHLIPHFRMDRSCCAIIQIDSRTHGRSKRTETGTDRLHDVISL